MLANITATALHETPSLPDFVCDAVIDYLRRGHLPTDEDAQILNKAVFIDHLRNGLEAKDSEWLLDIVETASPYVAGFAATLLQPFACQPEVSSRLRRTWHQSSSAYLKTILTWRILDDPNLDFEKWNEPMFQFLMDEWTVVREQILGFWHSPAEVVPYVKQRLANPFIPTKKKWIYLCNLPEIAQDPEEVKALLNEAPTLISDSFAQVVAARLLKRFFAE